MALALAGVCLGTAEAAGPDPRLVRLLEDAAEAVAAETDHFDHRFEAQVWLTDMSNRLAPEIPDPARRVRLLRQVHREARRADLPPELVLAVIDVESDFNRFAISSAGALGLMQVMPFWLEEIGRPGDNLFHVSTNLRMGCTILRYYLDRAGGDMVEALARYNGSYGRPDYARRVLDRLSDRWYRQ